MLSPDPKSRMSFKTLSDINTFRKEAAVIKIQSFEKRRQRMQKQDLMMKNNAALTIQCAQRRRVALSIFKELAIRRKYQNSAALTIQCAQRRFVALSALKGMIIRMQWQFVSTELHTSKEEKYYNFVLRRRRSDGILKIRFRELYRIHTHLMKNDANYKRHMKGCAFPSRTLSAKSKEKQAEARIPLLQKWLDHVASAGDNKVMLDNVISQVKQTMATKDQSTTEQQFSSSS